MGLNFSPNQTLRYSQNKGNIRKDNCNNSNWATLINSSVGLVDLIKRIVAPLFLLLGVILVVSGIFNAFPVNEIHTLSNEVIITYPKLLIGSIMSIGGLVISILSYIIFHGKIKLQKPWFVHENPIVLRSC